MTQGDDLQIKSVAVIGSGAAGLTTLFELLHTKRDGSTTIMYTKDGKLDESVLNNDDPAFYKVVAFEQTSRIGGIWAPSFENPDKIPQEALETEKYNDPYVLKPKTPLPEKLEKVDYPLETPFNTEKTSNQFEWNNSGIYKHLYSNVPSRYLRNSFIPYGEKGGDGSHHQDLIEPLISNGEITNRLLNFAERYNLLDNIRLNSEVARIRKTSDGKRWRVSVKHSSERNSIVQWYTEYFDAIIVSTGHYSVPYLPYIEGLSSWSKENPSSIFHSKSFRDPNIFKDKVCLFVGTGLSGIDILQYAFPIAKQVIVSRSEGKEEIYKWLTNAATSDGIVVRPRIKKVETSQRRKVTFEDGSSIENVDYIIFSTGYHWHYPFLDSEETGVAILSENGNLPDGSSMVAGLYLNTFSIKDPTLAFVGVTISPFKWPSFELAASAIAGVWTNNRKLPNKDDQKNSVRSKIEKTGQSILYHYYAVSDFSEYVQEVSEFLPKGRYSSNIFDGNHLDDMYASMATAERLFYQLKNSKIPIQDTIIDA